MFNLLSHSLIDFSTVVSDNQLEQLAQACQPATYGVPQQDVLDESYRKAGKLDAVNFSTNFNPNSTASGIMEAIRSLLLKDPKSSVQVKLHKLNVYGKRKINWLPSKPNGFVGPGSFFKAHVDTPKSGKMFGSLVLVLPTKHEGGTFPLRHDNREWVFNSADLVSPQNTESPRAAFVAFFGDIEQEVTEVISGYRVTLTYNLYFGDDESTTGMTFVPSTMLPIDDTEVKIKELLISLLNNPKFLSDGGLVGFGLSHLYPISSENINLLELGENLKGIDAAIKRACDSLSLNISVKMVYNSDIEGVSCLLDDIADPGTDAMVDEEDVLAHLQQYSDGLLVYDQDWLSKKDLEFIKNAEPISWLKPFTERNELESPYVAYGNQLSGTLGYRDVYGEVCLVLTVDAYNDRKTYQL